MVGQSQLHPGLRRGHQGRQGRRGARRQRQVPGRLSAEGRWPARTPSSRSRSRRWPSRSGPSSTTSSPRRWAPRSLAKLRELVGAKIASEYATVARMKLKRQILDALDKAHDFTLPETLVDQRVRRHLGAADAEPGAGRQDACRRGQERGRAASAEYRKIAERRVRLGLVIGEIGEKSKHAGEPGGAAPRADRAGAPLSGPGEIRLRVLREEPGGAGRAAGADLRGQGDRPHRRARPSRPRRRCRWRSC